MEADHKEGDMSFFGEEVTKNVPRSVFIGFLVTGILAVIGSCMMRTTSEPEEQPLQEEMKVEVQSGKSSNKEDHP